MLSVTNLLHESVPVSGVTDTVFTLTDASATRLAATLTLNALTNLALISIQGGDSHYTSDGTNPTTSAGHGCYDGSQMWVNPSTFATLRFIAITAGATLRVSQYQYNVNSYRRATGLDGRLATFTFSDVYNRAIREMRHTPTAWLTDDSTASSGAREQLAGYIERRVRDIWTLDRWADLEQVVEADTETTGDRVYIALQGGDIANPGEILDVLLQDPFTHPAACPVPYSLSADSIFLHLDGLGVSSTDSLYVLVRPQPPRFTRTAWSSATAYIAGDVVYYDTTGDCYLALTGHTNIAPTNTAYWERQLIPHWMLDAILFGVAADWVRHDAQAITSYSAYRADYAAQLTRIRQQRGGQQRLYQFARM